MKILHLGRPYFTRDFMELGHDVKWAAADRNAHVQLGVLDSTHTLLSRLPKGWCPDLVVLGDDSAQPGVLGLESLGVPVVWYAIDTHVHANWHRHYANVFDLVLVAQKEAVPLYAADLDRQVVQWAPLFCNHHIARDFKLIRDIPLSFVGTLNPTWNPDRVRLLEELQARYPIVVRTGEYVETFNHSMMVLNQSVAGDVNFRTFEAMACGALLVTERVGNGFDELLQDKTHCVLYEKGCSDQIAEIADHYLHHEVERQAIAARGHDAVLAAHTSRHRAQTILDLVATHDFQAMIGKRRSRQVQIQLSLVEVYETSARKYRHAAGREEEGSRRQNFYADIADRYQFLATTICQQLGPLSGRSSPDHPPTPASV
ncbi:MAG: CgeB family protein, partial [Nitrospiraceae bacterium]